MAANRAQAADATATRNTDDGEEGTIAGYAIVPLTQDDLDTIRSAKAARSPQGHMILEFCTRCGTTEVMRGGKCLNSDLEVVTT